MNFIKKIFCCPYNNPQCVNNLLGCKCGKADKASIPSPTEQSQQITAARDVTDPLEAQRYYQILSNPNYGAGAITNYMESVRQSAFPQETALRSQMAQNLLQGLQSGTGITAEQQAAIDYNRKRAMEDTARALQTRANIGGNLYGGRAIAQEAQTAADLQNAFAEQDIAREERNRQYTNQMALSFLQQMYPQLGLQSPQYNSSTMSPETYAQSILGEQSLNMQNRQARNKLLGDLLQSFGESLANVLGQSDQSSVASTTSSKG
jgi:hypothetical protein